VEGLANWMEGAANTAHTHLYVYLYVCVCVCVCVCDCVCVCVHKFLAIRLNETGCLHFKNVMMPLKSIHTDCQYIFSVCCIYIGNALLNNLKTHYFDRTFVDTL